MKIHITQYLASLSSDTAGHTVVPPTGGRIVVAKSEGIKTMPLSRIGWGEVTLTATQQGTDSWEEQSKLSD